MKTASGKSITGLALICVACLLAADYADARRGGGGGMRGGMSRMGPASSGSFQRPRAQPRPSQPQVQPRPSRPQAQPRPSQPQQMDRSQARLEQRDQGANRSQEDRQERQDNRQENINDREDFREDRWDDIDDHYDDRQDWYRDRWAAGAYVSVAVWSTMSCNTRAIYVNGLTYYDCHGVRYEQVMHGSQVTYIIVN